MGRGWTVNHTQPPHGAPLSLKRPRQDRGDSGVSATVWGGLEVLSYMAPTRRVPITRTAHARPEGLKCMCRFLGGAGRSIILDAPTGLLYPPNGPGRTGATRVYPPLCEEELESKRAWPPHEASLSP